MDPFRKVEVVQVPPKESTPHFNTAETKYWKKFKIEKQHTEPGAITHINFSQTSPHIFAVATATRIQIFDPFKQSPVKEITKFKSVAYSPCFRRDGKLIAAGGEDPVVKLFFVKDKTILRSFKGHKGPVHVVRFCPDEGKIMSASDDKTVRIWDIGTQQAVSQYKGHKDYIRCGAVTFGANSDLFVTGSYDHTIRVWDSRINPNGNEDGCVLSFNHGHPVEDVLFMPAGNILVSCGGNVIKVWDLLGTGNSMITSSSNHSKTITSLGINHQGTKLFSAGLDHMVKVYDVATYDVIHTLSYPAPILSLGFSPDERQLVVGMSDGSLSIKSQVITVEETMSQREKDEQVRAGTYRYFLKGKNSQALKQDTFNSHDIVVEAEKRSKLGPVQKNLNHSAWALSLDAALQSNNKYVFITVIEELIRRDALIAALSSRDDVSLFPILRIIASHILEPNFTHILTDLLNTILDLYEGKLGESPLTQQVVKRIKNMLLNEVQRQNDLLGLLGCFDLVLTAAATSKAETDVAPVEDEYQAPATETPLLSELQ